jgi:PhzF family phenazine biosynthesis protein
MKSYFVDAFTNEPFKGNPAGVCFLEQELDKEVMLKIAREFGFSETAFIQKTNKYSTYTIRYFSPKKEIPLCGHATLASAKVIFENTDVNEILFVTSENLELVIKKYNEEIMMEFPVYDTIAATIPPATLAALGLEKVINTVYSPKNKIIVLEIGDSQLLAGLTPDFDALLNSYENINGILVTARSANEEYDFHYRYFWPWAGTNEDPVTGGAQTFLAKYWAEKLNKKEMKAFQSSQRTGTMTVELRDNKVMVFGKAVIVLEGNLAY